MKVIIAVLGALILSVPVMILKSRYRKKRVISTCMDVCSFFQLELYKSGSNSGYLSAKGVVSGYRMDFFVVEHEPSDEISIVIIIHFNKLEQKKVDQILLDIQDGSVLADQAEISIITGGIRLTLFKADQESDFYIDAVHLLVDTCRKYSCH